MFKQGPDFQYKRLWDKQSLDNMSQLHMNKQMEMIRLHGCAD